MGSIPELVSPPLTELGWQVNLARNTKQSLGEGNRYLDELICLPARLTLGNFIEAARDGATDIIQFDSCGLCRMKAYWILQQQVLDNLGFRTKIHPLRLGLATPQDLHKVDTTVSYWRAWRAFIQAIKRVRSLPQQEIRSDAGLNIGIIGEIYTILEPFANNRLFEHLEKMDCFVHNSLPIDYFVARKLRLGKRKDMDAEKLTHAEHISHRLFPKNIGGHGNDSITHLIYYALAGYDGVIHVMPFPCMPEATVKPVLLHLAWQYQIPLLSLTFDGQAGEAGYLTRLEAFVDMLRRKKT